MKPLLIFNNASKLLKYLIEFEWFIMEIYIEMRKKTLKYVKKHTRMLYDVIIKYICLFFVSFWSRGVFLNIAVVDDLSADRVQLVNDIRKYARENAVLIHLTEYESGEMFLSNAEISSLDVVFLDIYMDGLTGMEVAHKIRKLHSTCQIVFVTTSPAFAVQSYEVRAFYYILKPYNYVNIANVMSMLDKNLQKSSRYIKVKEGREWCRILLSDILYADYNNHYVQIHTENAIISTYMKFSEIQEKLLIYREFLNCYRCIVINMNKIKKIDDVFFLLSNGEYVPINRKRAKEVKSQYVDYIFGVIEEDCNNDE